MSRNNSFGNFKFFSKIDTYESFINGSSPEIQSNLGNLTHLSLTNDKIFLLCK